MTYRITQLPEYTKLSEITQDKKDEKEKNIDK
jgi:hypothetical protein